MGLHPIFIIMAITIGCSIAGIIKLFLIKFISKRTDETISKFDII